MPAGIRRQQGRETQIRRMLAVEAARLMAEQGIQDFLLAKRKAAARLMVTDVSLMPNNAEIEMALLEHQRLFQGTRHIEILHELRTSAVHLMQLLREFNPHLTGSVLSGSADAHSEISLHVFVDNTETLLLKLLETGIKARHAEKKVRYAADRYVSLPSFKFMAGLHAIEIVAFPLSGIRQSPLSVVDGKPMARGDLSTVLALLK